MLLAVITFQGFATHTVGASAEGGAGRVQPLAHAGAILAPRGSKLIAIERPAAHRIALTFDDGPNSRWTIPIADELRSAHVRATFFEIGSQVARYPDIVRTLVRDGDELGNHTFTHVLLPSVPFWQQQLQLQWTEAAIAGATGRYTRLVRPPYSATPASVTLHDERAYAHLLGGRYYLVLANYDSRDWTRPGAATIIRNALPAGFKGGIVMMHDGGGDRSQTLAALRKLIPLARSRGFHFVTISKLAGLKPGVAMPPAGALPRIRGEVFDISARAAYMLTTFSAALLITIAALVVARTVLLFGFAAYQSRATRKAAVPGHGDPEEEILPSAVIIVPAFNEAVGIERTVRTLAASDYPDVEVVVVDDGSTDGTAEIVARLDLPRVYLVRQDNAGKAAALQRGVDLSDSELVVMVDGDTQFEQQTLRRLLQPFRDPQVGAVSGNTKVGNRGGLIGRWQHLEYVIGFNLDRRMYHALRCMPTVPGAVGAFRRDVLSEVGGVPGDTIAEDTDLTIAIGRTGRDIAYVEDARAWTEAPSSLAGLWRQRYRWSFGTIQSVWKHRDALLSLRRDQRRIGWLTLPYLIVFYILLPLLAPVIDLFALYGLLFLGAVFTTIVWGAFNLLAMATAAYGLWLDREPLRELWAVPLQQFVYRQLMYLVIIESFVNALKGARSRWRHVPRTGDAVIGAK